MTENTTASGAADLPEFPGHPESHNMMWTALEIVAIRKYGADMFRAGRLAASAPVAPAPQPAAPKKKPLPDLMMAAYHEAIGWNACVDSMNVAAAPKAAPGDALDEAMRERDEAEDFINELLDEVLGADRPEWSSAYNRYNAMDDVRERITALHKPAVDKAWGQFESAMEAPQQPTQSELRRLHTENASLKAGYDAARLEIDHLRGATKMMEPAQPEAWLVYLPSIDTQHVYDSQDDMGYLDDLTNHADAEVIPLYPGTAPKAEVAPAGEYPAGAIANGRTHIDRLESHYRFDCEAGPLSNCGDWHGLKRCFEHLADCASRGQAPAPAAAAGPSETVKFVDESTADPVEKARRYLKAMGDQRMNSAYFFDDGYPRREISQGALATLAVLEQLAAAPQTDRQPAVQQGDADVEEAIKSAFFRFFGAGAERDWHTEPGGWFIEGYRAAHPAAPVAQGDAEQRQMDAKHAAIYRWMLSNVPDAWNIINNWCLYAEAGTDELHDALAARAKAKEGDQHGLKT